MTRWENFFYNIQQDFKLFAFMLALLCCFRLAFILILQQHIGQMTGFHDILLALYYGTRLSLKTAGLLMLVSFLTCTAVNIFLPRFKSSALRLNLGRISIAILTVLFAARIPYYEQFHAVFNQMLFNTLHDDVGALAKTLVLEYQLPLRTLVAAVLIAAICLVLRRLLKTPVLPLPRFTTKLPTLVFRCAFVLGLILFTIFIRFGGSLGYAGSVHWENAAISKDEFLNEAILDDVQALYRAYQMNHRFERASKLNLSAEKAAEYGARLSGTTLATNNINDYFRKEAQGALIAKPRHIFLVIGESFAQWPLLPKYENLHLADGVKALAASENAASVQAFLPGSTNTIGGVTTIITGMAEINLYPNYKPQSYKAPYATSLATQMKKLGYKTYFWYGGFYSWQRLKDFALSQGFDNFYAYGDMGNNKGNAWGMEDKYLLNEVSGFPDDEPSFHVILTTSNHPPFTVDLPQEGFDPQSIQEGLPDALKNDKEWLTKLGHFWYADKVLAGFIKQVEAKSPQSLFMITADHGDRVNIEPTPTLFDRCAVPFIVYGQGVTKHILPPHTAGSHLNIAPTLIELIAPKGFVYYSLVPSMTQNTQLGINSELWITPEFIGKINSQTVEPLPGQTAVAPPAQPGLQEQIDTVNALTWWRIQKGELLKDK